LLQCVVRLFGAFGCQEPGQRPVLPQESI